MLLDGPRFSEIRGKTFQSVFVPYIPLLGPARCRTRKGATGNKQEQTAFVLLLSLHALCTQCTCCWCPPGLQEWSQHHAEVACCCWCKVCAARLVLVCLMSLYLTCCKKGSICTLLCFTSCTATSSHSWCLCWVILYNFKSREQLVFGVDVFVYISCTYASLCEAQEPSSYKYSTFILLSIA